MTHSVTNFANELAGQGTGIVALIGGGGKTSLLTALGQALSARGQSVLCTTTTRLATPGAECVLPVAFREDPESIRLADGEALLAVRPQSPGDAPGKVRGYSGEEIDAMLLRRAAEWILVEADGSAGRPLKAPAAHEPVIPSLAKIVVAVVGLGGVGKPFGADTVFRAELAAEITGLAPGAPVTPEAAAALVTHPMGLYHNAPRGAAKILFCNQADAPGAEAAGRALARRAAESASGLLRAAYIGSIARDGLSCLRLPTA